MVLTSMVLPTPGPPVITSTFERSARRTASRWLSARVIPAFLGPEDRLVGVHLGPGQQIKPADPGWGSRRRRFSRGRSRPSFGEGLNVFLGDAALLARAFHLAQVHPQLARELAHRRAGVGEQKGDFVDAHARRRGRRRGTPSPLRGRGLG